MECFLPDPLPRDAPTKFGISLDTTILTDPVPLTLKAEVSFEMQSFFSSTGQSVIISMFKRFPESCVEINLNTPHYVYAQITLILYWYITPTLHPR